MQAGAKCAITSLLYGPEDAAKTLKMQADMINCPRIGSDDNFAYPTMQLNTAPAESAKSGKLNTICVYSF
jgi:hypothetical protein